MGSNSKAGKMLLDRGSWYKRGREKELVVVVLHGECLVSLHILILWRAGTIWSFSAALSLSEMDSKLCLCVRVSWLWEPASFCPNVLLIFSKFHKLLWKHHSESLLPPWPSYQLLILSELHWPHYFYGCDPTKQPLFLRVCHVPKAHIAHKTWALLIFKYSPEESKSQSHVSDVVFLYGLAEASAFIKYEWL